MKSSYLWWWAEILWPGQCWWGRWGRRQCWESVWWSCCLIAWSQSNTWKYRLSRLLLLDLVDHGLYYFNIHWVTSLTTIITENFEILQFLQDWFKSGKFLLLSSVTLSVLLFFFLVFASWSTNSLCLILFSAVISEAVSEVCDDDVSCCCIAP